MGDVGGDLETMRNLHNSLRDHASQAVTFKTTLDNHVGSTVWKGPNADKFRQAWEQFKPSFDKLHTALTEAQTDVKNQHNNLAAATGSPETI